LFFEVFIAHKPFSAPLPYQCSSVLGKEGKIVRCGSQLLPDVGVKVKLSEFKSLQEKLLRYSAKIATYSKQDIHHICMIRLVVLKRPGFQSLGYGMDAYIRVSNISM